MNRLVQIILVLVFFATGLKSYCEDNGNECFEIHRQNLSYYTYIKNEIVEIENLKITILNSSSDRVFVFFHNPVTEGNLSNEEFIKERFLTRGDVEDSITLVQALRDGNVFPALSLSYSFMKPIETGSTFEIIVPGNEQVAYEIERRIRITSIDELAAFRILRFLRTETDNWAFYRHSTMLLTSDVAQSLLQPNNYNTDD